MSDSKIIDSIELTQSHQNVVITFFKDDLRLIKVHFTKISIDHDKSFRFEVFKEFIYSASGMFKDIDPAIFSTHLSHMFKTIDILDKHQLMFKKKSQFPLKVFEHEFLHAQSEYMKVYHAHDRLLDEDKSLNDKEEKFHKILKIKTDKYKAESKTWTKEYNDDYVLKMKNIRRQHVEVIHLKEQSKTTLVELNNKITLFKSAHQKDFIEYFNFVMKRLEKQYTQALSYHAYLFNQELFAQSSRSRKVATFKEEIGISGELDLCKYLQYYLKKIDINLLADPYKKALLTEAKGYCRKEQEKKLLQ